MSETNVASAGAPAGRIPVSIIVAVRNEAANIVKCLTSLAPAREVIVVDSGSTDDTAALAAGLGRPTIQFKLQGGYPKKRQWAMDNHPLSQPWVMLIDADEEATPALWAEIERAIASGAHDAYAIVKEFHFMGQRMRHGGFSHAAVLLFRKGCARFEKLMDSDPSKLDMEVHERLIVSGSVGELREPLKHHDYKGLTAYIDRHNKYSSWEAELRWQALYGAGYGSDAVQPKLFGNVQERRRFLKRIAMRMPGEPWLWFCYHYLFKLGFLEGKRGLIAAQIRRSYIEQVRAKMHERTLTGKIL